MKGIVIAAGLGSRMGALTRTRPKCMLPIQGRTLLEYHVQRMRAVGCDEIVVVTGHLAERVRAPGITRVYNAWFRENNILHSLMTARHALRTDVLLSYADIYVEPEIYAGLAAHPGDLVLAVDRDWREIYRERPGVPVHDSETALYERETGLLAAIGKGVDPEAAGPHADAEFLGLWRMRAPAAQRFRRVFEELDARLAPGDPFRAAPSWWRASVTELFEELGKRGEAIHCAPCVRGWIEFDTAFDYARLPQVAASQRLTSLCRSRRPWGLAGGPTSAPPAM